MDNPNAIRYSDLVQPDSSITDLIAQLNSLIGAYENAQKTIQQQAAQTAKALDGVGSATDEQRRAIQLSTEASDKLLAQYRAVDDELMRAKRAQAEANAVNREYTQIAKLITEVNSAKEGSYKQLSAQYRLNKIALNEMSDAERRNTEFGRKLEAESKAIYERMNDLQKATGKAQLQVGQYERALGGLLGVNPKVVQALTDTKGATQALSGVFNALKGPIGIAIGAIGAATAAFKLFKDSIHATQDTGDAFDREMAGWKATWEMFTTAVSKVDFSLFINGARDAARAGRELQQVLDENFERVNSITIQRLKLDVANQKLLEDARDATKTIDERLAAIKTYRGNMETIYEQEIDRTKDLRDAALGYVFARTNSTRKLTEEEVKAGKERLATFVEEYNVRLDTIKESQEYNKALETSKKASEGWFVNPQELVKAEKTIAQTSDAAKEYADIVRQYGLTSNELVQQYIKAEEDYLVALNAEATDFMRLTTMEHRLEAQRTKDAETNAKARSDAAKKAAADAAAAAKAEADAKAKAAAQAIADERAVLNASLQSIQLQIAATENGTQEMLDLRLEMVEKQREIELFENRQKTEKLRQDEAAINAKYDTLALRETAKFQTTMAQRRLAAVQDYSKAEFDIIDRNERQKTLYQLQLEEERLRAILEINKTATEKMTEEEVRAVMSAIAGIRKQAATLGYNNLYELLGINLKADQQTALNTAIGSVKDSLGSLVDSWNSVAEAATRAADAQVDSAKKALDAEIEARNEGYANSVATAQKEYELAQKQAERARKEQARAQRAQLAADSVQQSSSLITASANIWKSLSGITGIGPALALTAIGTMWASFAAAKIKAAQVTTEKYGEGTVELLQGGSHASGHDIDLGTKADGTRRRAEGGEFFAVINKRSSRKYRSVIPDVIQSLNDGTFAARYQRANAVLGSYPIAGIQGAGTDVSAIEKDVSAIRAQGDRSRFVDGDGNTIEKYKNLTRKIYKN